MSARICCSEAVIASYTPRGVRAAVNSMLRRVGLRVSVEGCAWRRFMGDLERFVLGPSDATGIAPARDHHGLVPTSVRAMFEPIYLAAKDAASPGRPWHGAVEVFLPTAAFNEMVTRLSWLEHRLGSEETKHLTVQHAALTRAIAGELLDILGGVLSVELERRWERRLHEAEVVALAERRHSPTHERAQ